MRIVICYHGKGKPCSLCHLYHCYGKLFCTILIYSVKSDNWKPPESNCGKQNKLLNQNATRKYTLALAHQSSCFTVNIIGSHWNLIFSLKQIQETRGAQLRQSSRPQKRQWCRRRKVVNVCRRKPVFFVYGVICARVFGSLVPAWHLWSSKTSPCISLQSPVHTPKTSAPPQFPT